MKPRTVQELREDEVRKQAELIQLRIASAIPKFSRQVSTSPQGRHFHIPLLVPGGTRGGCWYQLPRTPVLREEVHRGAHG